MLIKNETLLRRFIPNALATVEGEASLYEKLSPYLMEAELFITNHFTGEEVMTELSGAQEEDSTCLLTMKAIATEAFRKAIPAMDLVLTPNGFGIVSNTNIAPASKERVDRLMDATEEQRDDALIALLKRLRRNSSWQESEPFEYWSQTLFPNIDICEKIGVYEHRLTAYNEIRPRIIAIETELANAFISPELLCALHNYQFGIGYEEKTAEQKSAIAFVMTRLQAEITAQLEGHPLRPHYMVDLVNFIRNNTEVFPEWESSETAKLFSPPIFENNINAAGYFF